MKDSYSTSEVARFCHVTADTIRKWAEAGRIQVFKTPGGHRRIRHDDLLFFLRGNSIPMPRELGEKRVRVLILEDDSPSVSAIRRFLDNAHGAFDIDVAADAFEAGHMMAASRPQVVLLGHAVSGMNASQACSRIAADARLAHTQIVIIANEWTDEQMSEILSKGAAACLSKPFTPDELRRALALAGVDVA